MSMVLRLASCQLSRSLLVPRKHGMLALVRMAKTCTRSAVSHDDKNMRLGRPQSPYLTIYKFKLHMFMSICQRGTGMIVAAQNILFALAALVLPDSIPNYIDTLDCQNIGEIAMMALKFCIVFPFAYHYFNGLRYFAWDAASLMTIPKVHMTGYLVFLLSLGAAAGLALL